jgi:hypothetical protein
MFYYGKAARFAVCYLQRLMAASFQATPASGTILVDNADNAVFRPFIPEITEDNNERNRTCYE